MKVKPGIYRGVSMEQYLTIDAVQHSVLRHYGRSGAHGFQEESHPSEPTDEMEFGTATHCAVLEFDEFGKRYVQAPFQNRKTKKEKEGWRQVELENPHAEVLRKDDYTKILAMRKALLQNSDLQALMRRGTSEVVAIWEDPITKLLCKCRVDWLSATNPKCLTLMDLKSCVDARPWAFANPARKFGYHTQAAFYLGGFEALDPRKREFCILAAEKSEPFESMMFRVEGPELEQGRYEVAEWLKFYLDCYANRLWPGYPRGIQPLQLPKGAVREEDW